MCRYVACSAHAKEMRVVNACSNEANIVQQRWTKVLRRFRLKPTSSNIIQHRPILSNIIQHYPTLSNIIQHYPTSSNIIQHHPTLSNIIQRGVQTTPTCWTNISASFEQAQHHPTWCSNEASMLHSTMLHDAEPRCWLRLNTPALGGGL